MIDTSKAVLWVDTVPTVEIRDGRLMMTVRSGEAEIRFALPLRVGEATGKQLTTALDAFYGPNAKVIQFPRSGPPKKPRGRKKSL